MKIDTPSRTKYRRTLNSGFNMARLWQTFVDRVYSAYDYPLDMVLKHDGRNGGSNNITTGIEEIKAFCTQNAENAVMALTLQHSQHEHNCRIMNLDFALDAIFVKRVISHNDLVLIVYNGFDIAKKRKIALHWIHVTMCVRVVQRAFRAYTIKKRASILIQRMWRETYTNPKYALCRIRLMREFAHLVGATAHHRK